jgi:Raf kinase inhibitor-like YbhB/YbcL family protein
MEEPAGWNEELRGHGVRPRRAYRQRVVFNLPASTTSLPAGAGDPGAGKLPAGTVQSRTDFGKPGYGGPCPPQGDKPHRYIFTVFALKTDKLADENASGALVGFMIHANQMGKATFTGKYGRK